MKKWILSDKELQAIRKIRNSVIHNGRSPSMRELMMNLGYRSPRSAALIVTQLARKGFLRKRENGGFQIIRDVEDNKSQAQTVDVPLVGTVACGAPVFAEENIEAMIPVSTKLARYPYKHFLLRASGDSMNKIGINDGDLVLVRQQQSAKNGDIVVALIDGEATIKEIYLSNEAIILKPRSSNNQHQPIVLTRDFQVQGVVVKSISNI